MPQDITIVVDNSYSVRDRFDKLNQFMTGFIDRFQFTQGSPYTPRISVVAFAGCRVGIDADCPPEPSNAGKRNSVQIIGAPSDDGDALKTAVLNRPRPSELSPFTCISCGIETVRPSPIPPTLALSLPLMVCAGIRHALAPAL